MSNGVGQLNNTGKTQNVNIYDFFGNSNYNYVFGEYVKGLPYVFFVNPNEKGCEDFPVENFKLPFGLFLEYAFNQMNNFITFGENVRLNLGKIKLSVFNLSLNPFENINKINAILMALNNILISLQSFNHNNNYITLEFELQSISSFEDFIFELEDFIAIKLKALNIIYTTKEKVFGI